MKEDRVMLSEFFGIRFRLKTTQEFRPRYSVPFLLREQRFSQQEAMHLIGWRHCRSSHKVSVAPAVGSLEACAAKCCLDILQQARFDQVVRVVVLFCSVLFRTRRLDFFLEAS